LTEKPPKPPKQPDSSGETLSVNFNLGSPPADRPGDEATGEQVAALQERIEALDNKLHEERFVWVLTIVVLFDVLFLLDAENWTAPVVIGILELIGLIVLAQKCRVDPIMPLLDKFTGMLNGKRS